MAERALELAASYATTEEAFRTIRRVGETIAEEDLVWCARESVSAVVPRFDGMRGTAARLVASAVRKRSTFPAGSRMSGPSAESSTSTPPARARSRSASTSSSSRKTTVK